jgi:hypothetical protein
MISMNKIDNWFVEMRIERERKKRSITPSINLLGGLDGNLMFVSM